MPAGQKNLLAFALLAGLGFVVTLYLVPTETEGGDLSGAAPPEVSTEATPIPSPYPINGTPVPEGSSSTSPEAGVGSAQGAYRGYALALAELRGLSPEVPPGSRLQLWVSWEPPITKHPRVQRLPGVVLVDQIVEPLTPEGPISVELLIPTKELPDFLFAHRYGALSAVLIP